MFTTREDFFDDIRGRPTEELLDEWLFGGRRPHVFHTDDEQSAFFEVIQADWVSTEQLSLAGTGAWRYSLNPKKEFREFARNSDIDVINISETHFYETWDQLRGHHRRVWYAVDHHVREQLRRTGQNVYCGFASPKWIPEKGNPFRFEFETRLEKYAGKPVGYRTVNMMFFRNHIEAKDYYRRGIEIAKSKI
ncbi:MAG: hypothetical protein KDN22_27580 [Verrucomicrobiae bacterium]|nr:hypothetical protein [Verrucomicrobiae bacterium]